MMSGDEFYDDEVTSRITVDDYRDMADFERKRRRETSSCHKCGSPDPVRLGVEGCSDCYDGWPRCPLCKGWSDTGLHHDHAPQ